MTCVDPQYGEGDGHGCYECLALAGYGRRECGMRFGPIFAYLFDDSVMKMTCVLMDLFRCMHEC